MRNKLPVAAILLPCLLLGGDGPKVVSAASGTPSAVSGQERQDPKEPSTDELLSEINMAPIVVLFLEPPAKENELSPEFLQVDSVLSEFLISGLILFNFSSYFNHETNLAISAIRDYFGIEKNKKSAIFVNGSLSKTYQGLPDPKDIRKLAESLLADLNRELKANPRNSSLWLGSITHKIGILSNPELWQEYVKKNNINVAEWDKDFAELFYKMHIATNGLWQDDPSIHQLSMIDRWAMKSLLDIKNPFFDAIIADLNKKIQSNCAEYKYAWLWNYFFPKTSSAYTNPASLIPELEHMPYANIDAKFYSTILYVLFQMQQYDLCISLCKRALEPFELEGEQLDFIAAANYRVIFHYLISSLFKLKKGNVAFEVMQFWEKKSIPGWDWSDICDTVKWLVKNEEKENWPKWFQFFEESIALNASSPKPQTMPLADKAKAWVKFSNANPDNVSALRILAQNIKSIDAQDKENIAKKLLGAIENNELYVYNLNLTPEDLYLNDDAWQKILNVKIAKLYQDFEYVPMDKTRWDELFYCIKYAKQKPSLDKLLNNIKIWPNIYKLFKRMSVEQLNFIDDNSEYKVPSWLISKVQYWEDLHRDSEAR